MKRKVPSPSLFLNGIWKFLSELYSTLPIEGGIADDTELGGAVAALEDRVAVQKDLDQLEQWAGRNLMESSQGLVVIPNPLFISFKNGVNELHRCGKKWAMDVWVEKLNW